MKYNKIQEWTSVQIPCTPDVIIFDFLLGSLELLTVQAVVEKGTAPCLVSPSSTSLDLVQYKNSTYIISSVSF